MTIVDEAGAVVARAEEEGIRLLLVTAKKNPAHWLFPKGHIEPGESPQDAAAREVLEEAGVKGSIVSLLDETTYELSGDRYRVRYFLLQFGAAVNKGEGRAIRWSSIDDALRVLTFPETREMLRRHRAGIERHFERLRHRS